jgi:outer membrane receptor protein involved in Fe transport
MAKWRWIRRGRKADVTDNTRPGRPGEPDLSSRAAWRLLTRRRRVYILLIETLLILGVALIGHITGRELARRQLLQREQTIVQLREERQQASAELNRRADRILTLQTRLNHVQSVLDEIVPSENIYVMLPNQSLVVAGGQVTVGLVGSPTNKGVNINVNGTQRLVNAGDIMQAKMEDGRTCNVTVQSFDMFKVVLHAICNANGK